MPFYRISLAAVAQRASFLSASRSLRRVSPALLAALIFSAIAPAFAQKAATPPQKNDEEYTKLIQQYLQDPRFSTELVDHLPASSTVPTPLKFLGTMPGQPGELYYSEDINRYFEAL